MYGTLILITGFAFIVIIVLLVDARIQKRKRQEYFDYWERQHRLLAHQPELCRFFICVGKSFRANPILIRSKQSRMFELHDAEDVPAA